MATVELSKLHWRASLVRFSSTLLYLLVALSVSIFFSYFKFYEISESTALQEVKYSTLKKTVDQYLNTVMTQKSVVIQEQKQRVSGARYNADQAYLGLHPDMPNRVQGVLGKGGYWEHFNEVTEREKLTLYELQSGFDELDKQIKALSMLLSKQGLADLAVKTNYQAIKSDYQMIGNLTNSLMSNTGQAAIAQAPLDSYQQYVEIKPSLDILDALSPLALFLAIMVDLFTLILSYRLEAIPPQTLSEQEKKLAFLGLQEFPSWKINNGGQLETGLDYNQEELAEDYDDSGRKLVVGMLLNRGMLRKVSGKKVEFSPQLYPVIVEQLVKEMEASRQVNLPLESTAKLKNTEEKEKPKKVEKVEETEITEIQAKTSGE